MKKTLVVMLVMAMVSMASAGVELVRMDVIPGAPFAGFGGYIAGDVAAGDFANGEIIPLAILVTGADIGAVNLSIQATGGVQFVDGGYSVLMDLYSMPETTAGSNLDLTANIGVVAGAVALEGANTPPATIAAGVIMYGFSVEMLDNSVEGALLFSPNSRVIDTDLETDILGATQGITFIPEPMTVALLGLGGLFLRRRK